MTYAFLDGIIEQVRQETNRTGALVKNLQGTIPFVATADTSVFSQEWYVLKVPATGLMSLRDFVNGHSNERYPVAEANAIDGVITYPNGATPEAGFAYGFVTQILLTTPATFDLTVAAMGAAFSIWVDGGLLISATDSVTIPVTLSAGEYNLTVVVYGAVNAIEIGVPVNIKCSRLEVSPAIPEWQEAPVAQYLEPANGSYQVLLQWKNDPSASEWQVYRAQGVGIAVPGTITLTSIDTISLAWSADVPALTEGASLSTDTFPIGVIDRLEITRDGSGVVTNLVAVIRVDPAAPLTIGGWAGRAYFVAPSLFSSVARVTYAGQTINTWTDTSVRGGQIFFYKLTAFSYLKASAESDFSAVQSCIVRDTVAPGNVTLGTVIKSTNDITIPFTAPTDADYRATNVYRDVSGTLTLVATEPGIPGQLDSVTFTPPAAGLYRLRTIDWAGNEQAAAGGVTYTFDGNYLTFSEGTSISANFTSAGNLVITIIGPVVTDSIKAAVSTSAYPSGATVDAAVAPLASTGVSMVSLQTSTTYTVGTRVYISAKAYIGGIGQRLVQMELVRDAGAGSTALGPNLDVRMTLDSTAPYNANIVYVATGTVEISDNGGAYVAAPSSPFTRARPGVGSDVVSTVTLRATQAGQTVTNTVIIPPRATIDTDTVTADLTVTENVAGGGDPTLYTEYTVTCLNPKTGTSVGVTLTVAFLNTTVDRFNGTSWENLPTSPTTISTGDRIRCARPANSAAPASVTFTATIVGGGGERIMRTITPRAVAIPPTLVLRQFYTTTTCRVQATTQPSGGTVQLYAGSGGLSIDTGPAISTTVFSPDATEWVFNRPAPLSPESEAVFRGQLNGVFDWDSVFIAPIGRDTQTLTAKLALISPGPVTNTYRFSFIGPNGPGTGTWKITNIDNCSIVGRAVNDTGTISPGTQDGDYGAGKFVDFVVTRPAVGGNPGRIAIRIDASGYVGDADAAEMTPQLALTPGRLTLAYSDGGGSGANITLGFKAFDATGTEITSTSAVALTTEATPIGGGTPTYVSQTVTRDTVNNWFAVTIARTVGAVYRAVLFILEASPTARTEWSIPLPTYSQTPKLVSLQLFRNVSPFPIELTFTPINAPAGATYQVQWTQGTTPGSIRPFTSGGQIMPTGSASPAQIKGTLSMIDSDGNVVATAALPINILS